MAKTGYNPYRKANGEFATKEEVGAQVQSDYEAALSSGDTAQINEIEEFVMDKMDTTPLGQRILQKRYGKDAPENTKSIPKLSVLNRLIKTTDDINLQRLAVQHGSERTLKSFASNDNAKAAVLAEAFAKSSDKVTQKALLNNKNYPLAAVPDDSIVDYYKSPNHDIDVILKSGLTANQTRNLLNSDIYTKFVIRDAYAAYAGQDEDPNEYFEIASQNESSVAAGISTGRFPADRIKDLPKTSIAASTVRNIDNKDYLDAYTDVVTNMSYSDGQPIAEAIVNNPHSTSENLEKLADAGFNLEKIAMDRRVSMDYLKSIEGNHPSLRRLIHLRKVSDEFEPKGLRKGLLKDEKVKQPYANRGYYETTYTLDLDKVKKYNLTSDEISEIFHGGSYNAGTGELKQTFDSTD